MKRTVIIIISILVLAFVGWYFFIRKPRANKRQQILTFLSSMGGGDSAATNARVNDLILNKMTDAEINDLYDFFINKSKDSGLRARMDIISTKYNVFT